MFGVRLIFSVYCLEIEHQFIASIHAGFCEKTFTQLIERFGLKVDNFHYLTTPPKVRFSLISRFLMSLGF